MTRTFRIALALLAFSLLGLAITGQLIYSRLSYLWAFLILGNYALSRVALSGLHFKREARFMRGQVGQIFEENFEVRNSSRLPRIWLEIQDESGLPGSRGSRVLSLIGGKRTRNYVSRTRLVERGAYRLGPTILVSGDPFGFFPVSKEIQSQQTLTVYPKLVDIESMPNLPGLLPGGEAIRRRTHQITPNASTVRDYVTGDPLNRIHWASSARRDRMMVKEFELDPLAEVWIFLDAESKAQAAKPYTMDTDAGTVLLNTSDNKLAPSTEEYAASLAASVARYYLRHDRSVGLMAAGHSLDVLPADRGGRQLSKIMETLAIMRADGDVPYAGFVASQARYLTRGSTVVLITASVDSEIALLTDQLLRLGLRPITLLLNALSFGGALGSKELISAVGALGVPHKLVSEGDNLEAAFRQLGYSQMFSPIALQSPVPL